MRRNPFRLSMLSAAACLLFSAFGGTMNAYAQQEARWLRYPAISPDGKTIVFGYMGNLYKVSSEGGAATPITTGGSYNMRPVWSRDGKNIAFASDRDGNFDVFVMPAEGGIPTRLTFNSRTDIPFDFTPDGTKVLFGSAREAPASSVRFPDASFNNLYTVPVKGGRPILVTAAGADEARYSADGTKIIFQDRKGYEDEYRKHHTSSVTRDIWIYDIPGDKFTQVTDFKGEDRTPAFADFKGSADNAGTPFYYSSERDGTLNIYKRNAEGSTTDSEVKVNGAGTGAMGQAASSVPETELTHFKDFPVREMSVATDEGSIAFVWKGDIYTLKEGKEPHKLDIKVAGDAGYDKLRNLPINSLTEFEVSPNGKEIAFVNRGEVFVAGVKDSRTKRITDTPYQERMVSWSPDGKYIYYSAEKDSCWGIYRVSMKDTTERYFYASTLLKTEPVVVEKGHDNFQSKCSPDGKALAYVCDRNELKVRTLANGKTVTVLPRGHNHSYSDGDWDFQWSPDSKWLLADDQKDYMFLARTTSLVKADGTGEARYPVNSGFGDYNAKWGMEGKAMLYMSGREGMRGPVAESGSQDDIYAVFFDRKAFDKFNLSKADFELAKEKEDAAKAVKDSLEKAASKGKKGKDNAKGKTAAKAGASKGDTLGIDFDDIENRKVRLTINSGVIGGYVATKDLSKVYFLQQGTKGFDLWVTEPRSHDTKVLAPLGGSSSPLELSKDESTVFLINEGVPVSVNVATGEVKPISLNGRMELNSAAEREYIFDHIWRQVVKKFYDPKIHGIDWKMYHDEYAKFLPYINNNYDFRVLLSELLGELNGSHTGGRFYPQRAGLGSDGDKTAFFGLLFDEKYDGAGIKVSAVIPGSPADRTEVKIKAGDVITAINGEPVAADENWNKRLLNLANVNTLLTIQPASGASFTQEIRPNGGGEESQLLYQRWTKRLEKLTDSLSHGRLGYVHVQGMDENSYRATFDKVMGKFLDKEAIIVDTRSNGGGWLHDDLNTFLSGKLYMTYAPQGEKLKGGEPLTRWSKPSIVLISENNYSDAYMFPFSYHQNGIGKLVGMPVPGTGTAVWWETQIDPSIIFGIPMIASMGTDGVITENTQLEPDIKVTLPYNDFLTGKDTQLEAAVAEMLKELDNKQ